MPTTELELEDGRIVAVEHKHPKGALADLEMANQVRDGKFTVIKETSTAAQEQNVRDKLGVSTDVQGSAEVVAGRFAEAGTKAAIPLGMEIAGQTIGTRIPIPGARQVLGGTFAGIGEYVNQLFGITEKSTTQIMLATGLGPLLSAGGFVGKRLFKGAVRHIPGASATINELGAEAGERYARSLLPGDDVNAIWDVVDNYRDVLDWNQTLQASDAIIAESKSLVTSGGRSLTRQSMPKSLKASQDLSDTLSSQEVRRLEDGTLLTPGKMRFKEGRVLQKSAGDLRGQAGASGLKNEYERLKDLHQAFKDDILIAIESGALPAERAETLLKVIEQTKQKLAGLEIAELVARNTKQVSGGFIRYDPSAIVNKLRDPKVKGSIVRRVGKEKYDEVFEFFNTQNEVIIPIPSQGIEQAGVPGSFSRAIIAGGAASILGASRELAGTIAGGAVVIPILIGKLVLTKRGRAIVKKALGGDPSKVLRTRVGRTVLAAQGVRAGLSESGPIAEESSEGATLATSKLRALLQRRRKRPVTQGGS